jgi:thiamine-monophosphate kinase
MTESDFLALLRALPLHPGARGLRDDAAVVNGLVLTTDTLVEGVHFLARDPPGDVAWKLLAVNLSDLAAKGATPEGVLLNYPLSDPDWDRAFLHGFDQALREHACPLIGGDTVTLAPRSPRVLTLTALGRDAAAPPRTGAGAGDALWVTGTVGDGGAGLELAKRAADDPAGLAIARGSAGPPELLAAYRRPVPRLVDGRALALHVHAMSDVSDGLLLDAARMAEASGLAVTLDLAAVPLSPAYLAFRGEDRPARLAAATSGDDYQLLFAASPDYLPPVPAARIGAFAPGQGLTLHDRGEPLPLPASLGYEHTPLAPARGAP